MCLFTKTFTLVKVQPGAQKSCQTMQQREFNIGIHCKSLEANYFISRRWRCRDTGSPAGKAQAGGELRGQNQDYSI